MTVKIEQQYITALFCCQLLTEIYLCDMIESCTKDWYALQQGGLVLFLQQHNQKTFIGTPFAVT